MSNVPLSDGVHYNYYFEKIMRILLLILFLIFTNPCFAGVDFDNTDDVLNCGSDASLDNRTTFTACVTFKAYTI